MSAEPPNLQRLWDWAQSPTEAALYERNKPAYLKSLRDFLDSDDNATYGQWDKHCSVSNADLLPTSVRFPLPINIMETTELVNKGLKQCLFNEPTEPQKRKYALVYGEERRKNPKKRKLGSESEDSQSVSDDEELGSEFMEDVESDPEPPEGIDISMGMIHSYCLSPSNSSMTVSLTIANFCRPFPPPLWQSPFSPYERHRHSSPR